MEASARVHHVLIVCSGNICRSPMAEGLLKALLPPELEGVVQVTSAGTLALHGNRAEPNAILAMAKRGIDISAHRARLLSGALVGAADRIVVMEPQHARAVRRASFGARRRVALLSSYGPNRKLRSIPDPIGAPLSTYEACARLMEPCLEGLRARLLAACRPPGRP